MKSVITHTGQSVLHVGKPDLKIIEQALPRLLMAAKHYDFPPDFQAGLKGLVNRVKKNAVPDEVSNEDAAPGQEPLA